MQILLRQLGCPPLYNQPVPEEMTVVLLDGGEEAAGATVHSLRQQVNRRFSLCCLPAGATGGVQSATALDVTADGLAALLDNVADEWVLLSVAGVRFLRHALYCFAHETAQEAFDVAFADEFCGDSERGDGMSVLYPKAGLGYYKRAAHLPLTSLWRRGYLQELLRGLSGPLLPGSIHGVLLRQAMATGGRVRHIQRVLTETPVALAAACQRALLPPPVAAPAGRTDFLLYVTDPAYAALAAQALRDAHPQAQLFIACLLQGAERFQSLAGPGVQFLSVAEPPAVLLSRAFALGGAQQVVVLKDLADVGLDNVFYALLEGLAESGAAAASPLVHLPDGRILYAGAVADGPAQYLPLFSGKTLDETRHIGPVAGRREIGLLSGDCFVVTRQAWDAMQPIAPGLATLRELAVEISLKARAMGRHCLYCGDEALLMSREDTDFERTGTGAQTLRWLREYPALLAGDAYTQRDQTLYLNHIGYEVFDTFPGRIEGQGRRILAVTHELTLTGAPLVLVSALALLGQSGCDVVLLSPCDGPIRQRAVDAGITVIIDPAVAEREDWEAIVPGYDMLLICTVVLFPIIKRLMPLSATPVLWWLHDADAGFRGLKEVLPETLAPHIRVFCAGEYSRRVQRRYRPQWPSEILLYGIDDLAGQPETQHFDLTPFGGKRLFAFVGSIEERKGQDILVQAIGMLPDEIRRACCFLFVGKVSDEKVFSYIRKAQELYGDNVRHIERIEREEISSLYRQVDCLVCSSRDDPMPVYITEGMMFSRVVICSENTGTAAMLQDGVNGFVYGSNSPEALAGQIIRVVQHIDAMDPLRQQSRATYEAYFTMEGFRRNLLAAVDATMRPALPYGPLATADVQVNQYRGGKQ